MKLRCYKPKHCKCKVFVVFTLISIVVSFVIVEKSKPELLDYLKSKVIVDNEPVDMNLPGLIYISERATDTRMMEYDSGAQKDDIQVCKVPELSLETDANPERFVKHKRLECDEETLFHLNNSHLELNKGTIEMGYEVKFCEYRAIERYTDDVFTFSEPLKRTKDFEIKINHDFFMVDCLLGKKTSNKSEASSSWPTTRSDLVDNNNNNLSNSLVEAYPEFILKPEEKIGTSIALDIVSKDTKKDTENYSQQFFAQIHAKEDVLARISNTKPHVNSTQMNVLILSVDSVSHLHYQRAMPKTYKYLNITLGAVILNGYNIVGDGTTAAFIPFLTGKTESELPDIRRGVFTTYADSYPMIWNEYTKNGYVTMYGEDRPSIDTFQMRMNGFNNCPVDHYMRHFWQAVYYKRKAFQDKPWAGCLDGRPRHNYVFDYVRDYFVKYTGVPKFALQHLVALPHSNPAKAGLIDEDIHDLLHDLNNGGHLDNTLLITMSDHGSRFDKARGTTQGKLEERLPMMSLRFPTSFQNKYPNLLKNLKLNAERLTTPFDIHETLQTVLAINKAVEPVRYLDRGISLLNEIPLNRTCASAGVDIHWCTCMEYQSLNTTDDGVKKLAEHLVKHINRQVQHLPKLCAELHLKTVLDVRLIHPNEKLLKFSKRSETFIRGTDFFKSNIEVDILHYQITIETSPNAGQYEATLRGHVKSGSYDVIGDVSRINMYGDQPKCIIDKYPNLRKYCYCRPL